MTKQITFNRTVERVSVGTTHKTINTYRVTRLMNLPKWTILIDTVLNEDQYNQQLTIAEQDGIDVILE